MAARRRGRQTRWLSGRPSKQSVDLFRLRSERAELSIMPWYHALPLLAATISLAIIIFTRPTSVSRPMAFTLLIGGLMLLTLGLVVRDLVAVFYLAAWLASS